METENNVKKVMLSGIQPSGDLHLSLKIIALLRLLFPKALIPATTAFGSLHPQGREKALRAGANVMMPNLSPTEVRKLYDLYENKICTGEAAAQCSGCLAQRIRSAGYRAVSDPGDSLAYREKTAKSGTDR